MGDGLPHVRFVELRRKTRVEQLAELGYDPSKDGDPIDYLIQVASMYQTLYDIMVKKNET